MNDKILKPNEVFAIYDNGGETVDRYTFVLQKEPHPRGSYWPYIGTDEHGHGYSQYGELQQEPSTYLGKKVTWSMISEDLKSHIVARLEG
jgi:hypothetical protein